MNWSQLSLGQMTEPERPITYGVVKPGPEDPDRGVFFVRGGDIREGKIALDCLRTITQDYSRPYARTVLRGGELLISLVGNPGEVAIAPESLAGANIARQAGLIALRPDFDSRYVMYYLKSPAGRAGLFERTQGAVQQVINLAALKTVKINLPDLPVQQRIAAILSAYDDLIENNRRRIALLEDAARQLYKEWFVRFRFPGHEHVTLIDGVPEGWERLPLGAVLTLQRGFDLPLSNRNEGSVPVYGSTGIVGFHDAAKVDAPMLITGRSGSLGQVCIVSVPCWPLNTALWVREFKRTTAWFAYFLLSEMGLEKFNGGASVPTLDRKVAHAALVILPSAQLLETFDEAAQQSFELIDNLTKQNHQLAKARDLLLPRLMSGTISV